MKQKKSLKLLVRIHHDNAIKKPWTQLLTFAHTVQSFKQKSDVDGGGMR